MIDGIDRVIGEHDQPGSGLLGHVVNIHREKQGPQDTSLRAQCLVCIKALFLEPYIFYNLAVFYCSMLLFLLLIVLWYLDNMNLRGNGKNLSYRGSHIAKYTV